MDLVRSFAEARGRYLGRVGLVPTMGFFHEGHLALMQAARQGADTVVVSHFVNPLQFDDPADLARYPRDLDRDAGLAETAGVDLLFVPQDLFPAAPATRIALEGLGARLEGAFRPGHFTGVATVVAKLFAGLQPDLAYFGRKDAQQVAVIRRLVEDLSFPVRVLAQPTVRESDGLALSSRNVFLTPDQRPQALLLSRGLLEAAEAAEAGERNGAALESLVRHRLAGVDVDYVALASQDQVERLTDLDRPAFLAAAVRVGEVRLIDNVSFDLVAGEVVADRGVRLDHQSLLYR
jgi:pantoate--beta-alanine ligase